MALVDVQCEVCGKQQELNYRGCTATEAASKVHCPVCEGALRVVWQTLKPADPVINFKAGFYNIGTADLGGKYYSSLRAMRNDAAKHGIKLERT